MRTLGRILGGYFWLNVIFNVLAIVTFFILGTKATTNWQLGILMVGSFLALIVTNIKVGGRQLFQIFPGQKGWAFISIFLIVVTGFILFFGDDYIDSWKSRKDAFMRDRAIDNNVAESQLETFSLPAGTPLYNQKEERAVFYGKSAVSLVVRLKPGKLDIEGVLYRQVVLPVKRDNAYIEGVWDSTSKNYLVEVVSLTENRREKKKIESLQREIDSLKEKERQRELDAFRQAKEDAERRVRKLACQQVEIAEERKRKIITFTQADDNDPRPFGIRLDIPAQLGDRIRLLSDLIVRSDNRQQGAVVINNKTACCQKGSDIIFLKRGNIYQLTNSTIISITRSGANWVRLEKPLRLEVIKL